MWPRVKSTTRLPFSDCENCSSAHAMERPDKRHGRQRREGSGRAQRELTRYKTLIADFRSLLRLLRLTFKNLGHVSPRFFFFTLRSARINFESWLLLSSVLNTLSVCLNTSSHRILKIRSCASVRI